MNCRLQVVARIFVGYVVLHANKLYRNIKNRTVCFQERFRLLSLAAVLRKYPSWFQNPIDIVFWNRNVYFLRTGRSQNPENKSVLFFIKPRLCGMQYPDCENPSIQNTSGRNQSQPKFHNVNCRFCGAIHSVDWACIRVLSQVIHSVNEKKNDITKYYFLRELWRWDSKNIFPWWNYRTLPELTLPLKEAAAADEPLSQVAVSTVPASAVAFNSAFIWASVCASICCNSLICSPT